MSTYNKQNQESASDKRYHSPPTGNQRVFPVRTFHPDKRQKCGKILTCGNYFNASTLEIIF